MRATEVPSCIRDHHDSVQSLADAAREKDVPFSETFSENACYGTKSAAENLACAHFLFNFIGCCNVECRKWPPIGVFWKKVAC